MTVKDQFIFDFFVIYFVCVVILYIYVTKNQYIIYKMSIYINILYLYIMDNNIFAKDQVLIIKKLFI